MSSQDVSVANTNLRTFRILSDRLTPDQLKVPSVSGPLRQFELLRSREYRNLFSLSWCSFMNGLIFANAVKFS
jgi:hypothetical protein